VIRRGWWRYALPQRLGALAAAALILWTAITAVAASLATERMGAALLRERQGRARGIAARIELALEADLRQLDLVAAEALRTGGGEAVAAQVRRLQLAESVVRVDPRGTVLWARSVADGRETVPLVPRVPDFTTDQWHVEGTSLVDTPHGPRAFLLLPARESDPIGGAIGGVIDPGADALRTLLAEDEGEPYRVELLDDSGREVAASRAGAGRQEREEGLLVAEAAVADGRWRVRLAQPRQEALAPVLTLRRILVGSSLLLLPFAVVVAVAAARSIRQPVLAMTATAERLARGELTTPIPPAGEDEIGRLALALETLRAALETDERRARLLKHVIAAQEEERRRIARELHDQTLQQLTALTMQLEGGPRNIARAAIDDLHRLIRDLRPSMLDDLGLLPALRSYAESHLGPHGITVHCEFPERLPPLAAEAATALYRVGQEAITNIARHARAETVLLACTVSGDRLALEVEDDGAGFEPSRVARPSESGQGLGLLGMRERLALVGGSLAIESEPGRGTRVVASMPLHAAAAEGRG
jgi:signal transduction histidine kinase